MSAMSRFLSCAEELRRSLQESPRTMDWTSLIGPAVVAAIIAAIVSVIGFLINRTTVRGMHAERLAFDEKQAERRTTAEITLTERKAAADIALAERRFALDKALAIWRRRYDLAEQVLAAAYEARDALIWARGLGVFSGEGESRKATEPESDKVREARNSAFVPIERLARNTKAFATLQTLQDSMAAHFGPESSKPISSIIEIHHDITSTASVLIQMTEADEDHFSRQQNLPFRTKLCGERPDETDRKLDAAIEQLEAICKPVLSEKAPA